MQGGDVGIQVGVLADEDHAFVFPRVSHVGDDDPQIGAGDGNVFQLNRVGVLQRSRPHERCSLVNVHRNAQLMPLFQTLKVEMKSG